MHDQYMNDEKLRTPENLTALEVRSQELGLWDVQNITFVEGEEKND